MNSHRVLQVDRDILPRRSLFTTSDWNLFQFVPSSMVLSLLPMVLWTIMVLLGTVLPKSSLNSLSLRRSIQELLVGRRSRLDVLDVFRFIAIIWVMINHTGSEGRVDILDRLPSAEGFKRNVHEHPIFGALLGNSALGVEVFLVLSGLLAARSWLRQGDQEFSSHYVKFIAKRILRLLPSMAFFIYFAAGPVMEALLPRFHSSMVSTCGVRGLSSHLSFLSNWQSTPTCMGYLWYLSLDMQLYLAAPFLLHLMHKSPRTAFSLSVVMISLSSVIRAFYCSIYGVCNKSDVDIPFISFPNQTEEMLTQTYAGLWEMYARPYTKCGPYLLGLMAGYFTVHFDKLVLTRLQSRTLFRSSFFVAVATIYAILPEYWYPDQGNTVYNTTYTAVFRTVFAMAVIGMLLALVYCEQSLTISPMWAVLGRLTYNSYLLHMPIIYVFNFLPFLQTAQGALELLVVVPFVALFSFSAAFFFYIFVESPLGNITGTWAKNHGL